MTLLAVKKRRPYSVNELTHHGAWSGEVVAFCPQCKALQTVWISDDKLVPTRKFTQEGKDIYHDCGSSQPCRLYISW
jgi:hypothetical protein